MGRYKYFKHFHDIDTVDYRLMIEMTFTIKQDKDFPCVDESINIKSILPIKSVMKKCLLYSITGF